MDRSTLEIEKDCSKLSKNGNSTHEFALELCECLIDQYLRWKKANGKKRDIAQSIALIFTAITPVLLLIPLRNEYRDLLDVIAAAAASVATIASGLLVINGWRENYVRYGYTWHTLQIERNRYLTHASEDYSENEPEEAARKFADRIEQIVIAEVSDWRAEMQRIHQQKH